MAAFCASPSIPVSGTQVSYFRSNSECRRLERCRHTLLPANRRKHSSRVTMIAPKINDKQVVTEYFNNTGFDRWNRIYSDKGEVNSVQLDIREGHAKTMDQVLEWCGHKLDGVTFCDAGCGVGSLALPLALRGAKVNASDISKAMVSEAARRARETLGAQSENCAFQVCDLENLSGSYDTVCCVDVMIHYPTDDAAKMIDHLCSLSERRLIVSFAPKTFLLGILKKIGEFFPGPSKATRAYLHSEDDIRRALEKNGMKITREGFSNTRFYFSRIIEAEREDRIE